MTTLTAVGNLTADPEIRFTPSGAAVVGFTVAATERTKNAQGQWEDGDTLFLRCSAWRKQAENVSASLKKGDRVVVTGRLSQRSYEAQDGSKRTVYEMTVDDVGVSLKWVDLTINRTERKATTRGEADPWASPSGDAWGEPPPF